MALVDLQLTARPYEDGRSIGDRGPFEELRGKAWVALDPAHAANRPVTDLELAARGDDGRVRFATDVIIIRPADPARRNRRLFFDIVNRGRPTVMRMFAAPDMGAPWLLERGYTIAYCGWQHDVKADGEAVAIEAPMALRDGKPLRGKVLSVPIPPAETKVIALADGDSLGYVSADLNDATASLTECEYPMGPGRLIPRDRWSFARLDGDRVVPDPRHVYCADGFKPGRSYEIVYQTENSMVTGAGLAAVRDIVSFLRYAPADAGNPCAGDIDYTLSFGSSQSGRFLRQLVYMGFNVDEDQRAVFDGIHSHIAGGRRIEANWRYGQPGYNGPYSMSGLFPFTDADQTDASGRTDGILHQATRAGVLPRIVYTNSSCEYWGNYAALTHTTLDGASDAAIPDNVRIYHIAGTQHGGGTLPVYPEREGPRLVAYPNSTIDYRPLLRAALANLDAWVSQDIEPPSSLYPHFGNGTLVPRESLRPAFAALPGPGVPAHLVPFAPLDFGADANESYVATQLPPRLGPAYPELVAAVDADGNELGGLRHPDIAVPIATYTGWNPRHPDIGGTDHPLRLAGATMPFSRTQAEREAANDPRPSIAERYASRDAFLEQVRSVASAMAQQRLLLEDDIDYVVGYAARRYDELTQR